MWFINSRIALIFLTLVLPLASVNMNISANFLYNFNIFENEPRWFKSLDNASNMSPILKTSLNAHAREPSKLSRPILENSRRKQRWRDFELNSKSAISRTIPEILRFESSVPVHPTRNSLRSLNISLDRPKILRKRDFFSSVNPVGSNMSVLQDTFSYLTDDGTAEFGGECTHNQSEDVINKQQRFLDYLTAGVSSSYKNITIGFLSSFIYNKVSTIGFLTDYLQAYLLI